MIESASFISDAEKVNLSAGALFDRIINLKITCVDVDTQMKEVFVIRSDYEMVIPDATLPLDSSVASSVRGSYVIRRCTHKPSIKVQCKVVSSNTGINADVYVSNFFLLTSDGKHLRSFNNSQYEIESVEIAMGYWGQFKRSKESPVPTYDEFFDIKAENGADKITLTGKITVTTDKLPPDSVLHIHGYVANIYGSPVAISDLTTEDGIGKPTAKSGDNLKDVLYKCVTRRYLNTHYFTDGEGKNQELGSRMIRVSEIAYYDIPVSYDKVTGLLSEADADKYGVKVYVTEKAKSITFPKIKDSDENEVDKIYSFESGWTVGETIARIITFAQADISYTFNRNGDVLVYSLDEVTTPDSIYESFMQEGLYDKTVLNNPTFYDKRLPAVYNINVDAVATIVCPFFTFFEPFQYIEFASRYALTSVVSYFASYAPSVYGFLVISANISFATVDDINEVQITAVASRKATKN